MNEVWNKLDRNAAEEWQTIAALWNDACGEDLALSPEVVAYNLQPDPSGKQVGWLISIDDEVVAFASASVAGERLNVDQRRDGWIDALAVSPAFQHRHLGSRLLGIAEKWLAAQGCTTVHLGCSYHSFVAGLPKALETEGFFERCGYRPRSESPDVWDVAANLGEYTPSSPDADCEVRPARPGDEMPMLTFLEREFSGRWTSLAKSFLDDGGRIADFMLLWTERGIDGFCHLTFEDSLRPIARHYPFRLPRPWGQLGPVGVSTDRRGHGFGSALMKASLRRLHDNGVNGCVIDWTTVTSFYAKFGFRKYRAYRQMTKELPPA